MPPSSILLLLRLAFRLLLRRGLGGAGLLGDLQNVRGGNEPDVRAFSLDRTVHRDADEPAVRSKRGTAKARARGAEEFARLLRDGCDLAAGDGGGAVEDLVGSAERDGVVGHSGLSAILQ